jgi:large subunit ribosomal protein L21
VRLRARLVVRSPNPSDLGRGAREADGRSRQILHSPKACRQMAESEFDVYAIVRAGGRQEKVAVGDVLIVDRINGEQGSTLELRPVLLVDGAQVTSDASVLAGVRVTAEVVAATKGPKIKIMKFKNKTGYRKRQGHRQQLTKIKVTGIER